MTKAAIVVLLQVLLVWAVLWGIALVFSLV
mgnify:CR=1 FL=1